MIFLIQEKVLQEFPTVLRIDDIHCGIAPLSHDKDRGHKKPINDKGQRDEITTDWFDFLTLTKPYPPSGWIQRGSIVFVVSCGRKGTY